MCSAEEEGCDAMTDFARMRALIRDEERLRWAIEKQMAKATKITPSLSQTGGGGTKTGSQVEDGAIMLAALKDEHRELISELEQARKELRSGLAMIKSRRFGLGKTFIRMRYLQGIKVCRISTVMNYSEQYVFRIIKHTEALIIKVQKDAEAAGKRRV